MVTIGRIWTIFILKKGKVLKDRIQLLKKARTVVQNTLDTTLKDYSKFIFDVAKNDIKSYYSKERERYIEKGLPEVKLRGFVPVPEIMAQNVMDDSCSISLELKGSIDSGLDSPMQYYVKSYRHSNPLLVTEDKLVETIESLYTEWREHIIEYYASRWEKAYPNTDHNSYINTFKSLIPESFLGTYPSTSSREYQKAKWSAEDVSIKLKN